MAKEDLTAVTSIPRLTNCPRGSSRDNSSRGHQVRLVLRMARFSLRTVQHCFTGKLLDFWGFGPQYSVKAELYQQSDE